MQNVCSCGYDLLENCMCSYKTLAVGCFWIQKTSQTIKAIGYLILKFLLLFLLHSDVNDSGVFLSVCTFRSSVRDISSRRNIFLPKKNSNIKKDTRIHQKKKKSNFQQNFQLWLYKKVEGWLFVKEKHTKCYISNYYPTERARWEINKITDSYWPILNETMIFIYGRRSANRPIKGRTFTSSF